MTWIFGRHLPMFRFLKKVLVRSNRSDSVLVHPKGLGKGWGQISVQGRSGSSTPNWERHFSKRQSSLFQSFLPAVWIRFSEAGKQLEESDASLISVYPSFTPRRGATPRVSFCLLNILQAQTSLIFILFIVNADFIELFVKKKSLPGFSAHFQVQKSDRKIKPTLKWNEFLWGGFSKHPLSSCFLEFKSRD